MTETTGAELLARQIRNEGVEDMFYLMGGPIIETAGFAKKHGIRTIDVRHEQAAAMAAHGYARVKRLPGVCLAASGPATTNLLTGVANAYLDCVPLVALGGAAGFASFETDAFQEYDQLSMAKPVTRWASRATHARRLPEFFNMAYRKARGPKPGPTYIDLPGNILSEKLDDERVAFPPGGRSPARPGADPDAIGEAINLLKGAERPLVITGSGIIWSGANEELRQFIDETKIPFYTTPQGRGVVPEDHEVCFLGARGKAFKEADVALVIGTRLSFIIGQAAAPRWSRDLKVIHVDIDSSEIGHNRAADVGIVADAKLALQELVKQAKQANLRAPQGWLAALGEADQARRGVMLELAESDRTPIHPLRVANAIVKNTERDAIISVDGHGTLGFERQWIPAFTAPTRLNPGPNGCMGVGLPHAMGAAVAAPDRQVVAFVGDGSFLMNVQELDTMARHSLPVVIVINNNGGWTPFSDTTPGRVLGKAQQYQDIAVALGGQGKLVTRPEDVDGAVQWGLEAARTSSKPVVVNVHVEEHASPDASTSFGAYQ
jgi:thiamine pyrophosphate-dependent acetolactate synthase large subunit-like protein